MAVSRSPHRHDHPHEHHDNLSQPRGAPCYSLPRYLPSQPLPQLIKAIIVEGVHSLASQLTLLVPRAVHHSCPFAADVEKLQRDSLSRPRLPAEAQETWSLVGISRASTRAIVIAMTFSRCTVGLNPKPQTPNWSPFQRSHCIFEVHRRSKP